jgi:hypothetical protein
VFEELFKNTGLYPPPSITPVAMSTRKNAILSGVLAVAVAVVILTASSFTGVLPTTYQPGTNNGTTNQGGNTNTGGNTNQGSGNPGGTPQSQTGMLSILATDPPQVPTGVSAVYMTYDKVQVHQAGFDPLHGWITINTSATIDAMSLVDVGQTLATAAVPNGTYDKVTLHITSVMVTYNGSTYGAAIASNDYTAVVTGGLQVSSSQNGAVMVEIQPLVLNVASGGSPAFVFNAAMNAITITPIDLSAEMTHPGWRMDLTNVSWWMHFQASLTSSLSITAAQLTNSSFSVTVKNTGNTVQTLRMVVLSAPTGPVVNPPRPMPYYILPGLGGSLSFAVTSSGALQLLPPTDMAMNITKYMAPIFVQGGYALQPGASVTLTYAGALLGGSLPSSPLGYEITVITDTTQAGLVLTLSA